MSEFRKLQAKLQKIEEGFYSKLAAEVGELVRANPKLSSVELVQLTRKVHGQEAATWLSDRLEAEGDAADYFAEDEGGTDDFWDWTSKYPGENIEEEETHMPDLDRYWVYINRPDVDYVMYHIPRSQAEEGEPRFLKVDKATGDWQTQNWKANNEPAVQQGKGTGPHTIEEDLHSEDSINDQIRSLLRQGKKVMSRVPGAIGTVKEIDERGISIVQHPPETKRGRSAVNFETFSNIEIIDQFFNYNIVQHWDGDEIDEAIVDVPAELRGDTKMTGSATSADARRFLSDLGPDDSVDTEVVDPETGELLDWPTKATRREQFRSEYEERQAREKEWSEHGVDVPTLHASTLGDFEDQHEAAWELLDELRNSDFYNVVWRDAANLVDDPEEMMSKDYDVYVEVPVVLKRKDGAKLVDADHDNIKEIIKAVKAASTMGNVGIGYAGTSDGGTTARFYPTFF